MLTQADKDYGFDENDVEELMESFYEAMYSIDQDKDYEDKEQYMITQQELQQAHNIISQCVIRIIFDNEYSFKREVLKDNGWCVDDYEIERVHCANAYRITLKHTNYREKDVYIDAQEVYSWFLSEQDKTLGE